MKININSALTDPTTIGHGKLNQLPRQKLSSTASLARSTNLFLWVLLLLSALLLTFNYPNSAVWNWGDIIRINGFTLLIWTTVTFFSAVLSTYSLTYLTGFKYHKKFICLSLGFTLSVMLFIASNHILLMLASWFVMGVFMAGLIGVDAQWAEAQEARKFAPFL